MSRPYTKEFFDGILQGSQRSASEIVPLILEMVRPNSVVDVGCGRGSWLLVFEENGVADFLGVDGDFINRRELVISPEKFWPHDLQKPLYLDREFDLVVSLEVAEHLPESCADTFVETLTRLGSVILFGAAIPHQGGTCHLNCQWPDYWAERFHARGYQVIDAVRKRIWKNERVAVWYSQNTFLYAKNDAIRRLPQLEEELSKTSPSQLSIVHPKMFLDAVGPGSLSLRKICPALPRLAWDAVRRRIAGVTRARRVA
jgi:SAM-dependent methyltransferase